MLAISRGIARLAHDMRYNRYNKPTVLEEIGLLAGSQASRNGFLSAAFEAANYAGYAGVLVWQACVGHQHDASHFMCLS